MKTVIGFIGGGIVGFAAGLYVLAAMEYVCCQEGAMYMAFRSGDTFGHPFEEKEEYSE